MKIDCKDKCSRIYKDRFQLKKGILKIDGTYIRLNDYGFKFCSICGFYTCLESTPKCKCCKARMRIKRFRYRVTTENKHNRMLGGELIYLSIEQKRYYMNMVS